MLCEDCKAAKKNQSREEKCKAGIHPYVQFLSGKLGCVYNRDTIEKNFRIGEDDSAEIPAEK